MKISSFILVVLPSITNAFVQSTPRAVRPCKVLKMSKMKDGNTSLEYHNLLRPFGTMVVTTVATLAFASTPAYALDSTKFSTSQVATSSTLEIAAETKILDMALPTYGSISDPNSGQDAIDFKAFKQTASTVTEEQPTAQKEVQKPKSIPTKETQSSEVVNKSSSKDVEKKKVTKEMQEQKETKIEAPEKRETVNSNKNPEKEMKEEVAPKVKNESKPVKEESTDDVAAAYRKAMELRKKNATSNEKEDGFQSKKKEVVQQKKSVKTSNNENGSTTSEKKESGNVGNLDFVDMGLPSYSKSTSSKERSMFSL